MSFTYKLDYVHNDSVWFLIGTWNNQMHLCPRITTFFIQPNNIGLVFHLFLMYFYLPIKKHGDTKKHDLKELLFIFSKDVCTNSICAFQLFPASAYAIMQCLTEETILFTRSKHTSQYFVISLVRFQVLKQKAQCLQNTHA